MKTMTVDNVRSNFDRVLEDVAAGERIEILRDSRHIATIDPAPQITNTPTRLGEADVARLLGEMDAFAKGNRLGGVSIRDLVNEGRKW